MKKLRGIADNIPRNAYIVGEKGPELFIPDRRGKIVPNRATAVRLAGRRETGGEVEPIADKFKTDEAGSVVFNDTTATGIGNVDAAGIGSIVPPPPTTDSKSVVGDVVSGIGKGIAGGIAAIPDALSGAAKAIPSAISGAAEAISSIGRTDRPNGTAGLDPKPIAMMPSHTPGAQITRPAVPSIGDDPTYYNLGRGGSAEDAMRKDDIAAGLTSMTPTPLPIASSPAPTKGSGSATFDGKTINYGDIGVKGKDPLLANYDPSQGNADRYQGGIASPIAALPPVGGQPDRNQSAPVGAASPLSIDAPITSKPTMEQAQDSFGRPRFDDNGQPVMFQRGTSSLSKFNYQTAAQAAKDAVKERLGFLPTDYDQNPVKYQNAVAGSALDLTGQAHLLSAQNEGAYQQGQLAIEKPYKEGIVKADLMRAEGAGALNAAHADALKAQAAYHRAISDPTYLHRQELIAAMKDRTARDKAEQEQTNHILTSMGADLSSDNVNLLRKYQTDSQAWGARAANVFKGNTPAQRAWANAFHHYVYADPKAQTALAQKDEMTRQMLMFVRRRDPSITERPMMPTTFRPARQLMNLPPAAGQEG
jgi:hypothetical protein